MYNPSHILSKTPTEFKQNPDFQRLLLYFSYSIFFAFHIVFVVVANQLIERCMIKNTFYNFLYMIFYCNYFSSWDRIHVCKVSNNDKNKDETE